MKKRAFTKLQDELLHLQQQLRRTQRGAVAVIVTGAPAAGRSETVNGLLAMLDPKLVRVRAFSKPDRQQRRYPRLWRYWRCVAPRGRIAIYFAGWYSELFVAQQGSVRHADRDALRRIRSFERMLHAECVHVLKIHLHIDRRTQRARLRKLLEDPLTRWRVTAEDRWFAKHHGRAARAAEKIMSATRHPAAPWHRVDGADEGERLQQMVLLLRKTLRRALRRVPKLPAKTRPTQRASAAQLVIPVSACPQLEKYDDYDAVLEELQGRLAQLVRKRRFRRHALVLAFEGMDAAGKGGAIRRITCALDARQYQVVPVGAPTQEERAHPYLWRFWRDVPERGAIAIFDRSWYGRVLVERVRGLTARADWQRAYSEILEFEHELAQQGIIIAKFWLSVSKREQLARFRARSEDPLKRFKLDPEDWTNRRFYADYQVAAAEMIRRTHAAHAPWCFVAADDKKATRLTVLRAVCERVEAVIG